MSGYMHLTGFGSAISIISFLSVISNTSLNSVTIQNQHIPCQTRKQRDKISWQIRETTKQAGTYINREADITRKGNSIMQLDNNDFIFEIYFWLT